MTSFGIQPLREHAPLFVYVGVACTSIACTTNKNLPLGSQVRLDFCPSLVFSSSPVSGERGGGQRSGFAVESGGRPSFPHWYRYPSILERILRFTRGGAGAGAVRFVKNECEWVHGIVSNGQGARARRAEFLPSRLFTTGSLVDAHNGDGPCEQNVYFGPANEFGSPPSLLIGGW